MGYKVKSASASKYKGLLQIELCGLNHPRWIFVTNEGQVPNDPWTDAPHGWTVRCCPEEFYEFGLPSQHMLPYSALKSVVSEFSKQMDDRTRFSIYPSWEFDISGCCLLENGRLKMEAVKGDIAPLLRGQVNPDLVMESYGPIFNRFNLINGNSELLSTKDQIVLRQACRTIGVAYNLVLEWTKTSTGEIIFHDWLEFNCD